MDFSPSQLKQQGREALTHNPGHRKLVLIHTGAILVLALTMQLLDWFLSHQINSTSGLSGIEIRAVLNTLQSLLNFAQLLLVPLWEIGYLAVTLKLMRRKPAAPGDLLQGFRIVLPALCLVLVEFGIYMGLTLAASYLSAVIFTATPLAKPLQDAILPFMNAASVDQAAMEQAVFAAIESMLLPIMAIFLLVAAVLVGPMYYRLRLTRYLLLDNPRLGAFGAIRFSRGLMRGNCRKLLKLDLSFWWFYALELLATAVYMFDMILSIMGIQLPGPGFVWVLAALALYAGCELMLHYRFRNQVFVTYASFYEGLVLRELSEDPVPQPEPPAYE